MTSSFKTALTAGAAAAKNDTFTLDASTGVLRFQLDVLANDPRMAGVYSLFQGHATPADKSNLPVLQSVVLASGATLQLDPDGTLWYEMPAGLFSDEPWIDTFLYTARISNGVLSTAEVSLHITPPTVITLADDVFLSVDTGVDNDHLVTSVDVLANDPAGTQIYSLYQQFSLLQPGDAIPQVTSTMLPSGALISIQPDGTIHYDASSMSNNLRSMALGESWFEQFYYSATLPNGEVETATARIEIAGVNDAPTVTSVVAFEFVNQLGPEPPQVIEGQLEALDPDTGAVVTFALAPDTDPVTPFGTFDLASDGTYSFTLNPGAVDELLRDNDYAALPFWVVAVDEHGAQSAPKAVWLYVQGFSPELVDDTFYSIDTGVDNNHLVTVVDVLANDPGTQIYSLYQAVHLLGDEPIPQVTSTTTYSGAVISIQPDGTIHYDGTAHYYNLQSLQEGESWFDNFDYHGILPTGEVATGRAYIEIAGVNDAPTVTSDVAFVFANNPGPESPQVVLGQLQAFDPDNGATVSFALAPDTSSVTPFGTFDLAADGSYSFMLDPAAIDALDADDYAALPLWVVATDERGAQSVPKAVWLYVYGTEPELVGVAPSADFA